jgi:hypothetical protein
MRELAAAMAWRLAVAAGANHHDSTAGSADATDQEKNVLSRNDDNPARRLTSGAMYQSSISLFYWT